MKEVRPAHSSTECGRRRGSDFTQPTTDKDGAASPTKSPSTWLRYSWAWVGILFALIYAVRPLWHPARAAEAKPPVALPAAAPLSEAQKLVAQAE